VFVVLVYRQYDVVRKIPDPSAVSNVGWRPPSPVRIRGFPPAPISMDGPTEIVQPLPLLLYDRLTRRSRPAWPGSTRSVNVNTTDPENMSMCSQGSRLNDPRAGWMPLASIGCSAF
jgi:hypothetical protein